MHKDNIKSCYPGVDHHAVIQHFGTTTMQLSRLCDDIDHRGIRDFIIESVGTYWVPLYDMLASRYIHVTIANSLGIKQIPGKKTGTSDSE